MFSRSYLPTELPPSLPDAVLTALDEYRQAVALHARATDVEGLGDRDLDAARTADQQLIMEALATGADIERVGRPNEAAFLAKRDAYRQAAQLASVQAAEVEYATAATLGEHSDAIVTAFALEAEQAAESYRAAVASLAAARAELERRSNRLTWATSIDGRRVPSLADENHPRQLRIRSDHYSTDKLAQLLEQDADELAGRTVAERQQRLEEAARQSEAEQRNAERIAQVAAATMARREARRAKATSR